MNYAIIENDSLSLRRIKEACERLRPEWSLQFTAPSISESALHLERSAALDLLICDIELDDGLIFSLFKKIKVECPVIFVTAFDEYALDAFKLFSIDYIMKPIDKVELEKAFLKLERIEKKYNALSDDVIAKLHSAIDRTNYIDRLLISVNDRFESLPISEVGCFISEDKYVFAIQKNGQKRITSFKSLNDIESLLDPKRFFRASRECIVTIYSISKVSRWFKGRLSLHVQCGDYEHTVLISSARRGEFLAWYGA